MLSLLYTDAKISLADLRQMEEKVSKQLLSEHSAPAASAPPMHQTDIDDNTTISHHKATVHAVSPPAFNLINVTQKLYLPKLFSCFVSSAGDGQ